MKTWWLNAIGSRIYSRATAACLAVLMLAGGVPAGAQTDGPVERVYIPYEKLQDVFGKEQQGVFLPYNEFQKLWKAAQQPPAQGTGDKLPYLITTAKFSGKVEDKLARLQVTLTVDVLEDGWVTVPLQLGSVAASSANFTTQPSGAKPPLLRANHNRYEMLLQGKGRWVLQLGLVRQLTTRPGLNELQLQIPAAAISTLELLIPEENLKVDVTPALATTTSQVALAEYEKFQPGAASPPALAPGTTPPGGKFATKLQAFMGSTRAVKLSWKPESQAAADLAPVVISDQFQHINVAEALLTREVRFTYDIRRRGIDKLVIDIPKGYRVTTVDGENLRTWNLKNGKLDVSLFSKVKDKYQLKIRMERFLKEAEIELPLEPVKTRDVLRSTGLIAITHAKRRSVEVRDANAELLRVDVARLPKDIRGQEGVTAYQFASDNYQATLDIGTVEPRITVYQNWQLGIDKDEEILSGSLRYKVDRAGIFALEMTLPEPWEVDTLGPDGLVDDYELTGTGADRRLRVTLKREISGNFTLNAKLRRPRAKPDAEVDVTLPAPAKEHLQLYSGRLTVALSEALRAEVGQTRQLQPVPLPGAVPNQSPNPSPGGPQGNLQPVMAFAFRAVDREQGETAGLRLDTFLKPPQVSAQTYQLVTIQPGTINHEVVIDYDVLYAPVDTFYLKMPKELADSGVQIEGAEIQEQPIVPNLPDDQQQEDPAAGQFKINWTYYKIVLQSPRTGRYRLTVSWRRNLPLNKEGEKADVNVPPVLATGKLSDQTGTVAIRKSPTLAIGKATEKNLIPADASSATDLPYAPHRQKATIAYKFLTTPFALVLPVTMEAEAEVFTTIANAVIVNQTLGRDGTLNARALYLLTTNRADRLPVKLPDGAKVYSFLLNGSEVTTESEKPDTRVVRLPTSAGNVTHLVLEVTYGVEGAWATSLPAPTLPDGVPVQKTIWQIWVPHESILLGYDHDFSRDYSVSSAEQIFNNVADGHPRNISKFAAQGRLLSAFVRQGTAPELSLYLMSKEWFIFWVWILVLGLSIWMLWLPMYRRFLVVLGLLILGGIFYAFMPLLISAIGQEAVAPFLLVLVIWLIHFFFFILPRRVDDKAQAHAAEQTRLEREHERFRQSTPPPPPPPVAGTEEQKADPPKEDKKPSAKVRVKKTSSGDTQPDGETDKREDTTDEEK